MLNHKFRKVMAMTTIRFLDLHVGTISRSSGVYYGSNRQWGYKHHTKQHHAFGTMDTEPPSISNTDSLDEQDHIDTAANKGEPDSP
jgi:hypothetical protein